MTNETRKTVTLEISAEDASVLQCALTHYETTARRMACQTTTPEGRDWKGMLTPACHSNL